MDNLSPTKPGHRRGRMFLLVLGTLIVGACRGDPEQTGAAPSAPPKAAAKKSSTLRRVLFSNAGAAGSPTANGAGRHRAPSSLEAKERASLRTAPRRNEQHIGAKLQRLAEVQTAAATASSTAGAAPLFLAELLGQRPMPGNSGASESTGSPKSKAPNYALDDLFVGGLRNGIAQADGYFVQMHIADRRGNWHAEPDPREALPKFAGARSSQWRCYAWPRLRGSSGHLAFMIDESGVLRACRNEQARYDGLDAAPAASAAQGLKADMLLHPSDAYRGDDLEWWRRYRVPKMLRAAPPK